MKEKPLTEFLKSEKIIKEKVKKEEVKRAPKLKEVEGPWELPEGWRWVRLRDVANLTSGGTPSRKVKEYWENGTIPWVKSGELEDNIIYETEEKITESGLKNSSAKIFPKGTLLIALYGATVGKTAILGIDATTNQAVCAVLPRSNGEKSWDTKFLQYYFIYIRPMLIAKSGGGAQPNIYLHTLKKTLVPLPPLEEQKRIVAKLDEIHTKLEEAKRLAREAKGQAEKLMASALHEIFSKADKRGWEWVRLEKVINIRGNSGVKKKLSQFDKVAFIPMELIPERGVFARYEVRDSNEIKSYSYCEPGDILLAKITPSFENGKQGIVPSDVPNEFALATTEVYPIYVKDTNRLNRMYLFYLLRSTYARKILEEQMLGTTGRQRVPKEAVLKLKIPLPPLEEQKCIVAYLDRISERVQRLVQLYEDRERELERLFPAVLDRAFRGEL